MINSIFYITGIPLPSPFFETEQHAIHDWNPDVFGNIYRRN